MNGADALAWCRAQPGTTEEFPFGPEACVFKVAGRMFALFPPGERPDRVNLKCDPNFAEALRRDHPDVILPGYHMSKRHWNTVMLDAGLAGELVRDLFEHSFTLVVDGLPRTVREELRRATAARKPMTREEMLAMRGTGWDGDLDQQRDSTDRVPEL